VTLPRSLDDLRGLRYRGWIRESTKGQYDRHGPESQRENIARFVERYGLVEAGPEFVVAHSGRTVWRSPSMAQLLDEVRAHRMDVLVVGYFDRWQRNLRRTLELVEDELHPNDVAWAMADRRLLSSDPADWDEMVSEAHEAEKYSRKLAERIRDGYAAKRRRQRDQGGGLVPYGFRRNADKLVEVEPTTMPRAIEAYELAATDVADDTIAHRLGLSLWTVRTIFRSPLFAGRLADGSPARIPAPVPPELYERATAARARRSTSGHQTGRHRVYPLTDRGPLVCSACGRALSGAFKSSGAAKVYKHPSRCEAWPQAEYRTHVFEGQVAQLLAGARPNRESAARIRAALSRPLVEPDRLAIARLDAEMRRVALSLIQHADVTAVTRLEELRAHRAQIAAEPVEADLPRADEALDYLADLGRLWVDTSDEGRRRLAVATFARLGAIAGRIVNVELTPHAERRGLALAMPVKVSVVGDTGFRTIALASWRVEIAHRREWLARSRAVAEAG
jgi:DNA invertase Pin-like site-specific DNA recombinase